MFCYSFIYQLFLLQCPICIRQDLLLPFATVFLCSGYILIEDIRVFIGNLPQIRRIKIQMAVQEVNFLSFGLFLSKMF